MRLVYLALAWTAGIVVAAAFGDALLLWVWGAAALVTGVALTMTRRWTTIVCAAFCLGGLRFALHPTSADVARYIGVGGLTLEGIVSAAPTLDGDVLALRLRAETVTRIGTTIPTSGDVRVEAPLSADVQVGDRVRATGLLHDPGVFDTFSYRDFLARQGIVGRMRGAALEVVERGGVPLLVEWGRRLRQAITAALPEPAAGLLVGILSGDDSGIAPEVRDAFNATGTTHVIAISGYNMVVLSGAVGGLLRRLLPGRKRLAGLVGIGAIALYASLIAASALWDSAGVMRAAFMSALLLIGGLLRRRAYTPASLALALLVLSLENPTVLWDVSFQFSAFAVVGIALFAEPLARGFDQITSGLPRLLAGLLRDPLTVGVAASILITPLVALYFHRVSLVSLAVNLLIAPAQPAIILGGGAAALVALVFPLVGQFLLWLALIPLAWTLLMVRLWGALPFASAAAYPSPNLIALIFGIVIGASILRAVRYESFKRVTSWLSERALVSAAFAGAAGLLILLLALWQARPDGLLHVWLLAVGDGNAVLVQTPSGAHMLIDGGRAPARLLTALGDRLPFHKRHIDLWVLTQPDERHFAALPALLDRYRIGAALHSGQPNLAAAYQQVWGILAGVPAVAVTAGYSAQVSDGARLEVLHPLAQPSITDDLDDAALLLRLTYGDAAFLLGSDLSPEAQGALAANACCPATVLQLPGQGFAWMIDDHFVRAVGAQVIVIGGDREPDPDLLAALPVLPVHADVSGTIHLWTDGVTLWLQTER
jgi:competence protein ComEC